MPVRKRCADPAARPDSNDLDALERFDRETKMTTLSGGSLGSCVDEERSQLRELM